MLRVKLLIVVTGTLRVEGGSTSKRRTRRDRRDPSLAHVTLEQHVSAARAKANVHVVDCARRLRKLSLLWTPFGRLLDPAELSALNVLLNDVTRDVVAFNREYAQSGCRLSNCYVWEPLQGNRKAAVEGYLARLISEHDAEAVQVAPRLVDDAKSAAA